MKKTILPRAARRVVGGAINKVLNIGSMDLLIEISGMCNANRECKILWNIAY